MKNYFSKIHFNSMLLAQEMEKRGIDITHLENTKTLIAEYKGHKEIIDDTDLSVMPSSLRYTLDNKWATKLLLNKLKIPTAKGKIFRIDQIKEAKKYAQDLLPVVIKPVNGAHGYGVRMNIDSLSEFEHEFQKLGKWMEYKTDILIEEQLLGEEFRLTITKNNFFAAAYRACPKVIGDGEKTIIELIEDENFRRMNPRQNCLCEIWIEDCEVDRYLAKKGLTLKYIPKKGEVVYLRANSNVCTGGECIDVTDIVHPFYKKLSLEILTKIPGLPYCGIDIITKDITVYDKDTKYAICEINPAPGISLHTHPSSGKPRNLTAALIDLIFPETAKSLFGIKPRVELIDKKYNTFKKLNEKFSKKIPETWFFKPTSVDIEITNVCNLRCPGCGILEDIKKGYDNFSAKNIIDVLDQCSKTSIYAYSITGGEPFLELDKMCEIIKNSKIDLFKIQTNATLFSSEEKTKQILTKLKKAGLAAKNKYIKPSINCSTGMQTKAGAPIKNVAIIAHVFPQIFGDLANLAINILPYKEEEAEEILDQLENEYKKLSGKSFPYEKFRINQFYFEYTENLAKNKLIDTRKVSIKDQLSRINNEHACFNFDTGTDTPLPRILVRANGDLYACSCMGHADNVGNINKKSLFELLEKINQNKLFKLVKEKGLNGLLEEAGRRNKKLLNFKIPKSFGPCKICKTLRNSL